MKYPIYNRITTEEEFEVFIRTLVHTGIQLHHTCLTGGYVSTKVAAEVAVYHGRFGDGYAVYRNNPGSSRYCWVSYYTKVE